MLSTRRRDLLRTMVGAAVAVPTLSACDLLGLTQEPPPPPDPLADFHSETLALVARYDSELTGAVERHATLTAIRDAHRAHADALATIMRPAPSPSPSSPAVPTPDGRELREAEQAAWEKAVEWCVAAPAERAVLLGEIAAARACHLEALA